jgi:hypothetical protein
MTTQTQFQVRHAIRPLNVFTFCGQPISVSRGEYVLATRDLTPCPDCQRARNRAVWMLKGAIRAARASGLQR